MLKYEFKQSDIKQLESYKYVLGLRHKNPFSSIRFNGSNCIKQINNELNRKKPIYELIRENSPVRPYIDFELQGDEYKRLCMNDFIHERKLIKKIILKEIIKVYVSSLNDLGCNITDENVLILDGSRIVEKKGKQLYKISFHLTTINNNFVFKNQGLIKTSLIPILRKLSNKNIKDGFDDKVYGKTQKFRCINSPKSITDAGCLIPVNKELDFINVINPIDYLCCHIPENPYFINTDTEDVIHIEEKTEDQKQPTETKAEPVEETEKDRYLISKLTTILRKRIKSAVYKYSSIYKGTKYYYYSYDSNINKCCNDKEHARSTRNNNILKVNVYTGLVFVSCFGSSCRRIMKKHIGYLLPLSPMYKKGLQVETKYLNDSSDVVNMSKLFIQDDSKKILCVRSCYGTGKTYMMKSVIPPIMTNIENKFHRPARICMISTRQSFARSISKSGLKTLKLTNYLEITDTKENMNKIDRIIISVESLHKITDGDFSYYDIVILDESESICRQFFSDTVKLDKLINYQKLMRIIKFSKKTLILDADLSDASLCLTYDTPKNQIIHINNTYKQEKKTYNFTNNKEEFKKKIIQSLETKKNIFIVCLSASETKAYEREINNHMKWTEGEHVLNINGLTSCSVKEELQDVCQMWKKYRCVITTSTTGAGIDFNKKHFNDIYGVITTKSATPSEFLQIMNRVRQHTNNNINVLCDGVSMDINKGYIYTFQAVENYIKDTEDGLIMSVVNYAYENEQGVYINKRISTVDENYKSFNNLRTHYEMNNVYNKKHHNYLLILKLLLEDRGHTVNINQEKVRNKKTVNPIHQELTEIKLNSYDPTEIKRIVEKKKKTTKEKVLIQKVKIVNRLNFDKSQRDKPDEKFLKSYKQSEITINNILKYHIKPEHADKYINNLILNQELKHFKREHMDNLFKKITTDLKYDFSKEYKIKYDVYKSLVNDLQITKGQLATLQSRGELKDNHQIIKTILKRYGLILKLDNGKRKKVKGESKRITENVIIKPDVKIYSFVKNILMKPELSREYSDNLNNILNDESFAQYMKYTKPIKVF